MKKIILLLLIVLVSCQKDDINGSIAGTEWIAQGESRGRSSLYENGSYIKSEYSTIRDITLKFTSETKGNVKMISVTTVDGVKQSPIINEATFTYTYDSEFMRGSSVYDIEGVYLTSTFEIRSGFLYEESDYTGGAEYRRK